MRFDHDRGTLVLTPTAPIPAPMSMPTLPGVLWDARTAAWRAPAFRRQELIERLEGARDPVEGTAASATRLAMDRWRSDVELRPHQEAALGAWVLGGRRGIVVLPTGSGKTRLACAAIAEAGFTAIILVPTRALLRQWKDELQRWYAGPIGTFGDGERDFQDITVATYAALWRDAGRTCPPFGTLILDEVHHFAGGALVELLEASPAHVRLGLTATPPEEDRASLLPSRVGPVVFRRAAAELGGSVLAPWDRVVLPIALPAAQLAAIRDDAALFGRAWGAFIAENPAPSWAGFVRHCSVTPGGRQALAAFRRRALALAYPDAKRDRLRVLLRAHRGDRVLVFADDNRTVYRIAREELVAPITCDIGRAERDALFAAFKRGDLRGLVSAKVLNEGIDVPEADVAIILSGQAADRAHVQRVGRVLRPAEGKRATVYELVVTGTYEVGRASRRATALGLGPERDCACGLPP